MAMTVLILQFTGTVKSNYVSTRTSEGHGKGKFLYSCPPLFLASSTERNSCTDPETIRLLGFIGLKCYTLIILLQIQG